MDSVNEPVIEITVAEHPRRIIKHYRQPGRVIWFAVRPEKHIQLDTLYGYKKQVMVTFKFRF